MRQILRFGEFAKSGYFVLALGLSSCSKNLFDTGFASLSSTGLSSGVSANSVALKSSAVASSVPTGTAVVARLQNGLDGKVNAMTGNFAMGLNQVSPNLPNITDPMVATGYDQIQLLAYAACSDLTTGGTPLMQSQYMVNPSMSISSNQTAIVSAGIKMLDRYTAGLTSRGPASESVKLVLNDLVSQVASTSSSDSTIAFMSVCMAANTVGSTLLGF